ncbi:DUF2510 domain-containing protein [Microbacterium sp. A204]|uniref:DUF2510 domain-containing protein n=1 Tax=Microbacterium sp. A204 TaxID=3457321 RepID=UPI003FD36E9F
MSAQPGWYDAGVPGQQRWWDGVQWTAHERAAAVALQPAPVVQTAPMGWYPVVGTADVRWWDGAGWTPYRLRAGSPRPDAIAIEPGSTGVALGIMFIVLSVSQFGIYQLLDEPLFTLAPFLFLIAGILWLIGGIHASRVRKLAAPTTAPVFDPLTRPLPGEIEGAGAGWFPVSGQIARWWTGAQWSPYIAQKFGVRPTHYGSRAYRNSMILGWVLVGLGVLATLLGVVFVGAVGWAAAVIIIPAVVFAFVGGVVLLMVYIRRYTLILPTQAPPLR